MKYHADHRQHIPAYRDYRTERTEQLIADRRKFPVDLLIFKAVLVAVVYAPWLDRSHEVNDNRVFASPVLLAESPSDHLVCLESRVVIEEVLPDFHAVLKIDIYRVLIGIDEVVFF